MPAAWVAAAVAAAGTASSFLNKPGSTISGTTSNETITGSKTTSTLDAETLNMLKGLVTSGQYSKGAAIHDSDNAVTAAIQEVMYKYMPTIAANEKGSGMMGDSMTQILANQTAIQAAVEGGKVRMDAINNYSNNFTELLTALIAGSPQNVRTSETKTGGTTGEGSATAGGVDQGNSLLQGAGTLGQLNFGSSSSTPKDTTQKKKSGGLFSSLSVICTKFHELGYLSDADFKWDSLFGEMIEICEPSLYYWYMSWAPKVVLLMDKSPIFTWLLWHLLGKHWTRYMASTFYGQALPGHLVGKTIMAVGRFLAGRSKFATLKGDLSDAST